MVVRFDVVDPRRADALWAMTQYFEELDRRFPSGFDPGDTLVADAPSMAPPGGGFIVASDDDGVIACGGVLRVDDATAEIKRMWVHERSRGHGVGKRMLAELESLVVALGYTRVFLDTNGVLTEAITMYRRAGYTDIPRYNDNPHAMHWFAKDVGTDRSLGGGDGRSITAPAVILASDLTREPTIGRGRFGEVPVDL